MNFNDTALEASEQSPLVLRTAEQIEALGHRLRQDIVDRLAATGPLTVAQLARLVGRRPDRLYYHLGVLKAHRIIREIPTPGPDVEYDVVGRPVRMEYVEGSREQASAVVRAVGTMLRSAHADFRTTLPVQGHLRGDVRTVRASRLTAWLTPDDVAAMNRHVEALLELFRGRMAAPGQGSTLMEVVVMTVPLPAQGPSGT